MLTLTKKTDYALIALKYMVDHCAMDEAGKKAARGECVPVSAREISKTYDVPLSLLMNILKELAAAGILTSARGNKGGYVLAVNPNMLTLDRVIRVIEGQTYLVDCASGGCDSPDAAVEHDHEVCKLDGHCPIQSPLKALHDRLTRFFETVTVQDICSNRMERSMASLRLNVEPMG